MLQPSYPRFRNHASVIIGGADSSILIKVKDFPGLNQRLSVLSQHATFIGTTRQIVSVGINSCTSHFGGNLEK